MTNLPALIKVGTKEKAAGFLGLSGHDTLMISPNAYSILLNIINFDLKIISSSASPGKKASDLDSDTANEVGTEVPAGRKVELKINLPIKAPKYHFLISAHPLLGAFGTTSAPTLVPAAELKDLTIYFKADRKINLADLLYLVQLTPID